MSDTALAPVILFAYMRPEHLRRTVASLQANPEAPRTHLTVFCDAAKSAGHQARVDEVRGYVDSIDGFASVTRVHRDENMGLARSIIQGVSATLREHDRVVVLEDDLVLSPHFLRYMNDGLARYRDDAQVASIHGYWYPTTSPVPETFFLKGADCWGWATWARAWVDFDHDGRRLLARVQQRRLGNEIDYDGNYVHMKILKRQIRGRSDSWAIRWHISCYLKDMLTLYPGRSLVDNIGHDDSGTHCGPSDAFATHLAATPVSVRRIPLVPSAVGRAALVDFFRNNRESLAEKVRKRLAARLKVLLGNRRLLPSSDGGADLESRIK